MLKEFKEFAMRGNVVDLAVGVIIGAAFGKIVTSLVNDIIMPPVGLLIGNMDFSQLAIQLPSATDKPVVIAYGKFFNQVVDFLIVAFCIFLIVKGINAMKRSEPAKPPAPSEKNCPQCLMTIPIAAKKCGHCTSSL